MIEERSKRRYVAHPATARERIQNFRYAYAQRREASKKGETRSGRILGRAKSGTERGRRTLGRAKEYAHKYGKYLKQGKEGGAFHLGQELRRNTPLIGTMKRKRGIRDS